MSPATLLRAAALAVLALSAAPLNDAQPQPQPESTDLFQIPGVGGAQEQLHTPFRALKLEPASKDESSPQPEESAPTALPTALLPTAQSQSPADFANEVFALESKARVRDHTASPDPADEGPAGTARDRLRGWPMTVLEKVGQFLDGGHPWQQHAVVALRAEVDAMRSLVHEASKQMGPRLDDADDDWEIAPLATGFPGAEDWPGAEIWPGESGWPGGFSEDVWQLSGIEYLHAGVLKVEPVESIDETSATIGLGVFGQNAARLWGRRKSRTDQLALRRDGAFNLLPAATVGMCDELIKGDLADVRTAQGLALTLGQVAYQGRALASLRKFIKDRSAADFFHATREELLV